MQGIAGTRIGTGIGTVRLDIYEGPHHMFQARTRELPSASRALDAAADFTAQHWA